MAITNAQQFKQLVNPPMKGKKRPGYRGEAAAASDKAEDRNAGRSDTGSKSGRGDGPGSSGPTRNPMVSLTEDPVGTAQRAREIIALGNRKIGFADKIGLGSAPSLFAQGLNLLKVPQGTFVDQMSTDFRTALSPRAQPDRDGSNMQGIVSIPTWMQLGFSSEAEYLASLEQDEEDEKDDTDKRFLAFRAEGGPIGGEYDFESARQMYGLGKLVKKVTRTVKKIAKSPIGKAAIGYALTGGLSNMAAGRSFGSNFFSPSSFISKGGIRNIFTKEGLSNIAFGAPGEFLGSPRAPNTGIFTKGTRGIFGTGGEFNPFTTTAAISLLGALTPEEELQAQELADSSTDFDLEKARNSILAAKREQYMMDVRARGFKADGGRIEYQEGSKEPVAKKTMPLLDMGGKEMDLREEGGFVPIGRMEKADDVPARLSKNEFVFTADAVRNAGDGNVDKGAEVMYNMMKNLESGGDVSEESQGLEGARKMFQTSQRLEEVL